MARVIAEVSSLMQNPESISMVRTLVFDQMLEKHQAVTKSKVSDKSQFLKYTTGSPPLYEADIDHGPASAPHSSCFPSKYKLFNCYFALKAYSNNLVGTVLMFGEVFNRLKTAGFKRNAMQTDFWFYLQKLSQ